MNRARVVLAEDAVAVRKQLEDLLSGDFDVVGAAVDGVELIALAHTLTPDVMVVDIAMPRMNGLDAVARLRREGNSTPVVFASVHSEPELIAKAKAFGRCAYVVKERAAEELGDAIRAMLATPDAPAPVSG